MSHEFNAITDGSYYKPAEHNPLSAGIFSASTDSQTWQRTLSSFNDNNLDMKKLGFPDEFAFETERQRDVYAPHNGIYTPVQPFGFGGHKGETWKAPRAGDNENVPWRNYLEKPVINEDGSSFYSYLGGITDAHQNNSFIAAEKHDADGRLLTRKAAYRHGVPMKFDMEGGKALDVNVKFVESCLDKSTGNYRTLVYPFDPSQPKGESKTPLRIITTPNGKSHFASPREW